MVEIAVGWGAKLERAEANLIQRLIVDAECLVRVLNKLVHRERRVIRLHCGMFVIKHTPRTLHEMEKARTSTTVSDTCEREGHVGE